MHQITVFSDLDLYLRDAVNMIQVVTADTFCQMPHFMSSQH